MSTEDYDTDSRAVALTVGGSQDGLVNNITNVDGQTVVSMAEPTEKDQPKFDMAANKKLVSNIGTVLAFAQQKMIREQATNQSPTFTPREHKTLNRIMSLAAKGRMPHNALSFIGQVGSKLAPFMSPIEKAAMERLKTFAKKGSRSPFPNPKGPLGKDMEYTVKNYFPQGQQLDSLAYITSGSAVANVVERSRTDHSNLPPATAHHPDYNNRIKIFVAARLDDEPKPGMSSKSKLEGAEGSPLPAMKRPMKRPQHGLDATLELTPHSDGGS